VKPLVIVVLLVALVAGGALAAILSGGDAPVRPGTTRTAPGDPYSDTTVTATALPETERTATEREPAASPRDEQAIERAIEDAIAAAEEGRPPPGIAPGDLPGSDELSIDSVRARGDRGSATLSSGAVVELTRGGGRWRIVAVRAP
jgi:hypothetical protein